ncbi:prephenate dehydratase [Numidum massiliense]|uniref:prephenate dehydratase n=1 Tax=Numidum massiliense TaxID=1522315 RepID=UPI0006D59DCA|nr:prephenate dehydratase [Numidum massiliense]
MKQTVAFLGPAGTFTQEAAHYLLPETAYETVPYKTIPDVLSAVHSGEVHLGVVPVENAIEGSVNLTLDWLVHQVAAPIVGELVYPVAQHLIVHEAHAQLPLAEVTKVLSHPQAIAQCRLFLRDNMSGAEIEYASSTAEAARIVSTHPEHRWAAIGTRLAQQIYNLNLREVAIADYAHNYTRFIVVGQAPHEVQPKAVAQKTSLLITLPEDFPGALYQVLATFAWRKINLTRIESRPTKRGLGSYHFFIDAEASAEDVLLQGAMREIDALGCRLRQLGSYPCYAVSTDFTAVKR